MHCSCGTQSHAPGRPLDTNSLTRLKLYFPEVFTAGEMLRSNRVGEKPSFRKIAFVFLSKNSHLGASAASWCHGNASATKHSCEPHGTSWWCNKRLLMVIHSWERRHGPKTKSPLQFPEQLHPDCHYKSKNQDLANANTAHQEACVEQEYNR